MNSRARARHRDREGIRRRVGEAVKRAARRISPERVVSSWYEDSQSEVVRAVSLGQRQAASGATDYVSGVAEDHGLDPRPAGEVLPESLSGVASDGRDLDSLMSYPVARAAGRIQRGMDPEYAMKMAEAELEQITATQISDAGRMADQSAMVATGSITGYVRQLNLPSCARCAILAGRFYKWSDGFLRHPLCDCVHIPATEDTADDFRTDPDAAFRAGQVKGLSESETKAIKAGANMAQVVNAKRGVYTASGLKFTREGVSRGRRKKKAPRLMPESIIDLAGDDRDYAVQLLKKHRYII